MKQVDYVHFCLLIQRVDQILIIIIFLLIKIKPNILTNLTLKTIWIY